jgi:hypothetical protein
VRNLQSNEGWKVIDRRLDGRPTGVSARTEQAGTLNGVNPQTTPEQFIGIVNPAAAGNS